MDKHKQLKERGFRKGAVHSRKKYLLLINQKSMKDIVIYVIKNF